MAVTVTNLLMKPARLYYGAVGAIEPPSNETALGAGWTDVGGTTAATVLTIGQTYTNMSVQQIVGPTGAERTDLMIQIAATLGEPTLENLRLALNQPTSAETFLELDDDAVNATANYGAICIEGQKAGGGARRVFARRTLSTESIGIPFDKEGQTVIPVTWTLYYVSSSVKRIRVEDTP